MRVTVVGNSGFIGGATAKHLRDLGCDLHLPSRQDLSDGPPKGGWGMLIWAAGMTANFRNRPFDTVRAHVSDLAPLLSGGSLTGVVYLSSTRVYMRSTSTKETAPLPCLSSDPSDLYNISKLMGESLCLSSGVDQVKIARLSNIVGPGEGDRDTFVGSLCREAKAGRICLQTDLQSQKDYLWIEDAARYLAALATSDLVGTFNIASGEQIAHGDWADALSSATGATIEQRPNAPKAGFPPIDTERTRECFGRASVDPLDRIEEILQLD